MEFFNLPEGYTFGDVTKVHNHSFLSDDGALVSLERGGMLPTGYRHDNLFRERIYFVCNFDSV